MSMEEEEEGTLALCGSTCSGGSVVVLDVCTVCVGVSVVDAGPSALGSVEMIVFSDEGGGSVSGEGVGE